MSTAVLFAVAAGLCSALPLLLGVFAPGGMLLVILTPLPLFLAGLAQGVGGAIIAGVTASAIIGVLGGLVMAAMTAIILAAPVAVLVRQALLSRALGAGAAGGTTSGGPVGDAAGSGPSGVSGGGSATGTARDWYPAGLLVTWLTVIGLAWLAVAFVVQGTSGGIEAGVREDLLHSLQMLLPEAQPDDLAQVAEAVAPFAVGSGMLGWLLLLAVNGVLAQGLLTRFGRNLRPAPDIATLTLPTWLAPALGLAVAAALLGSQDLAYIGRNVALVLVLPFFFAGLGTIHALTRGLKGRAAILVTLYIVLIFFSVWPAVLVAGLGLVEPWLGLRRRFTSAPGQEEE